MASRLHPGTVDLINYAEPDETGLKMVLAADLMEGFVPREWLPVALKNLTEVLADETISTADLKGPLNRASAKSWGCEYHRVFTPREFLEELKAALETFLQRG